MFAGKVKSGSDERTFSRSIPARARNRGTAFPRFAKKKSFGIPIIF